MAPRCSESTLHVLPAASQRLAAARQVPAPRCRSARHVQNVKNHLQKQRTKEAKAAAGGRRNSASRRSEGEEEDLDDADPMDSGEGPMSGGGAGPAPPRGAPAIWLSDSWAGPLVGAGAGWHRWRAGGCWQPALHLSQGLTGLGQQVRRLLCRRRCLCA